MLCSLPPFSFTAEPASTPWLCPGETSQVKPEQQLGPTASIYESLPKMRRQEFTTPVTSQVPTMCKFLCESDFPVQIPALPLTCSVTLGKPLHLLILSFLICKMGFLYPYVTRLLVRIKTLRGRFQARSRRSAHTEKCLQTGVEWMKE